MESLSPDLSHRLQSLGLCTPRDLRRARARVRRLTRDLPAFDSVWIDALVQLGRLSPYQAKLCITEGVDQLAVGPFVLIDRVGRDGRLETFTARQPSRDPLYELTRLHAPAAEHPAILERLQGVVARLPAVRAPAIVAPSAVQSVQDRLVAVAPWVAGKSLAELLVRRGRFPVSVVMEIARQLASCHEQLEQARLLHGDLRLRTVRLDQHGRLHLTQPGLLAALEPTVTIHVDIPADAYDGVAPELIDTHAVRSTASELYACGCLLWQLLAGRPPYPAGDPLVKLAAHQTRRIADVRQWRPDAPASLAELLIALTHPDPRQRPRSFADVATSLGRPPRHASPTLRNFARAFQSAAPRITVSRDRPKSLVRPLVAGVLLLCAALFGGWMHGGLRTELLRATQPLRAASPLPSSSPQDSPLEPSVIAIVEAMADTSRLAIDHQRLPSPRQGVVRLDSSRPYQASDLSTIGNLTVVGVDSSPAVIVVADQPLRVKGVAVVLQNVVLIRSRSSAHSTSLLEVSAEDFGLVDALLDGGSASTTGGPTDITGPALIHWQPLQRSAATGGRIGWVNTVLAGDQAGLSCQHPPTSIQCRNVLHTSAGPLLRLPDAAHPRPLPLVLRQVTLRGSGGLVALPIAADQRPAAITVSAERCLFDLAAGAGLFTYRGVATPAAVQEAVLACRLTGVESFLQTGSVLAQQSIPNIGSQSIEAGAMPIEGLQYSAIEFSAPPSTGWRAAVPEQSWVRLSAARTPGCDLAPLARFPSGVDRESPSKEVRTTELPPPPAR